MATLKTQKARKEYICSKCQGTIKKGTMYYRFSLTRFQPLRPLCWKCKPKRSEMTSSAFLSQMYEIEDRIAGIGDFPTAQSEVPEIISELESLRDETQEKLDNIPEQLQEADVGQLLERRVEAVEEMLAELEDVDLEDDPFEDPEKSEEEALDAEQDIVGQITAIAYSGD